MKDFEHSVSDVNSQADIVISRADVKRGISTMKNWKAPGPDGVRGFWFKQFTSLHQSLVLALGKCVESGEVTEWMVKGKTFLIQKDPKNRSVASNYRPIACLPLM